MYQNAFSCEAFNLPHITSIKEVEMFADYLVNGLNVNFHPDESFENYVSYEDGSPTFSDKEKSYGMQLKMYTLDEAIAKNKAMLDSLGELSWNQREYKTLLLIKEYLER